MAQSIQSLLAASVNGTLRQLYPTQYCSLCHVHAIVGANLISIVMGRDYRPVAGLAVIDCGGGNLIRLTDNTAFANPAGGAFHCWIESADARLGEKEVVDLTFRHNHEYAQKNGTPWLRAHPPEYLWGKQSAIVVGEGLDCLPAPFDEGKVWLRETQEGAHWMTRHLAENMNAYAALTAEALKQLQRSLPRDSTLLEPAMPALEPRARPERAPKLTPNWAPASAPGLAC